MMNIKLKEKLKEILNKFGLVDHYDITIQISDSIRKIEKSPSLILFSQDNINNIISLIEDFLYRNNSIKYMNIEVKYYKKDNKNKSLHIDNYKIKLKINDDMIDVISEEL